MSSKKDIKINKVVKEHNYAKYEILPFERGYGNTFATPLRRILLSSIPGTSMTKIRIKGVKQEYSTIPGIKQDVMTIILNLQKVVFKMNDSELEKVKLNIEGAQEVTAASLVLPGNVEVVNPEAFIAELTDPKAKLELEIELEHGYGFELKNDEIRNSEIGTIPLNKNFSPIEKVNVEVTSTRVEQKTDYEKITLEIWTNGGISPDEALKISTNTYYSRLGEFNDIIQAFEDNDVQTTENIE